MYRLPEPADAMESAPFHRLESRFRDWYAWTVDLPGTYYLQVVGQLRNGHSLKMRWSEDHRISKSLMRWV
jgi:hypothetical protein